MVFITVSLFKTGNSEDFNKGVNAAYCKELIIGREGHIENIIFEYFNTMQLSLSL
jgi:hypothetical protein